MTWLFFVVFFLHQDGMPWWAWVLFAGCVVWDKREEGAARARDLEHQLSVERRLTCVIGELQTLATYMCNRGR